MLTKKSMERSLGKCQKKPMKVQLLICHISGKTETNGCSKDTTKIMMASWKNNTKTSPMFI